MSGSRRAWLLALIAAVAAFVVFIPALDNEFVDWDDTGVLVENPNYRGLGADQLRWMFTTNHYGHYQPITWLTYGLDWVLWKDDPAGYHLTNNLFHAVNTLLFFFMALGLLRRAIPAGDERSAATALAALLAALLFGLHPLRVESVAWATERRDLVSAFFLLLTMLAYLRASDPERGGRWAWIAVTLVIYVVSMLSKVGGAPLPVVLLVLDWYPLRRLGGSRRNTVSVLLEKVPFFAIALGFSYAVIRMQTDRWLIPFELHDFTARTAQAFYGLAFYAWKTFLPTGLLALYELRLPLDPFAPRFIVAAVAVLAATVAAIVLARRGRPAALVAALCYAAMLGPLLGYFQNGPQVVADRYSYLSCAGWVLLVAAGARVLALRSRAGRTAVIAAAVAAVTTLGVMTWRQTNDWQDTATFWRTLYAGDPEGSNANNGIGWILLDEGRAGEAVPLFRKAVEINPRNREAYYNLWRALRESGRNDELAASYAAYADAPLGIVRADARYRLGNIALRARRNEEAIRFFRLALEQREEHAPTHTNLAMVLARIPDNEAALWHFQRAVVIDGNLVNARYGHARILHRVGRSDEAVRELRTVLSMQPGHRNARTLLDEIRSGG
ncbi:MAG: tetratricopeptide repeat protein [Planctomycetes bacterium]|nr:tetratricopeptide repeat protein [Planctomycetota bacterium]